MFVAPEDYADAGLKLDERLIRRPAATFFMTAEEDAPEAGVRRGDILVVDRAEPPTAGRTIVAAQDGALRVTSMPRSGSVEVWGVVLWLVRAP